MAVGGVPEKTTHYELLMNLSDENLTVLAKRYKRERGIPYASLALTNGKKIREVHKYSLMRFMAVGSKWRDDGTFFVLMEFNNQYELAFFSLDSTGRRVYEGLMQTKRFHYGRPLTLTAVHRSLYPIVMRVLDEKNLTVVSDTSQYIYCLPIEDAFEFEVECPDGFELRELEEHHADQINSFWTKDFEDSRTYIALMITLSGGWGLFKKSNGHLISWALRMALGYIGIVQTLEEYQRRGYGSLVVKKVAKVISSEDENPVALVPHVHEPAQLLFEKLGFDNMGTENTIELQKLDLSVPSSFRTYTPESSDYPGSPESPEYEAYEVPLRESAL